MKIYFLVILVFLSVPGSAQTKFNIQAGTITTTNHIKKGLIGGPGYTSYSSFNFGVAIKKALCKSFTSESGLFFNKKGYKFHGAPHPDYSSLGYYHANYITLNENFSYQFLNFKKILFAVGSGGFIGRGISGNYVNDVNSFGTKQHFEGEINFGNTTNDQFQSWDAGINFLLRAAYKKFDVTAMFSPSLANHIPKASQQSVKQKLQSISVNLGYNF